MNRKSTRTEMNKNKNVNKNQSKNRAKNKWNVPVKSPGADQKHLKTRPRIAFLAKRPQFLLVERPRDGIMDYL